ncbi:MAG: hypothetical protein ACO2ZD_06850, partial [Pseudomonadales bacterium]
MSGKYPAFQRPVGLLAGLACMMVVDQLRLFGDPWLSGVLALETQFYFALIALLLPGIFLIYPGRYRLIDVGLVLIALLAPLWLLIHAERILNEGWEFLAPDHAVVASACLWFVILEGVRRATGWVLFGIAGLFSLYPLFADVMPEMISGMASGFRETVSY